MELILLILAGLILFFVIVMIIDCNRFVIRRYECRSKKLNKDMKWILLSDLHNKSFGKKNDKLLAAIGKEHPDGILIAGDLYTSAVKESNADALSFLACLATTYPVYVANGNHEQKTRLYPERFGELYADFCSEAKKAGVHHLVNESSRIEHDNLVIYGLEMDFSYYKKFRKPHMEADYLNRLLGACDKEVYTILIAHNPDYFDTYAEWGADLTVSGHVHGGLMRLPFLGGVISPAYHLFPRFDGGKFEKDGRVMILSRGLGTHTLPIRIFNPGELVVIDLKKGTC